MKKKILSICLVAIIAVTAITGASLAYLTDRDSAENVFTIGNVEIELVDVFEQDSQLLPGKTINKDVSVKNTGDNDAWVWVTVAIPQALDSADASKNILHVNTPGAYWDLYFEQERFWKSAGLEGPVDYEQTWNVCAEGYTDTVVIDGVTYTLYTHLYNGILAAGTESTLVLTQTYLDPHIDIDPNGDLYWVEDGTATEVDWNIVDDGNPSLLVSAYAVQAEGFDTVEAAYEAYKSQWGDNGNA